MNNTKIQINKAIIRDHIAHKTFHEKAIEKLTDENKILEKQDEITEQDLQDCSNDSLY